MLVCPSIGDNAILDDLRLRLTAFRTQLSAALGGYRAGAATLVHRRARIEPRHGIVRIGKKCAVHEFACIYGNGGEIAIGDGVAIHPFAILYGDGNIRIGSGVLISAHAVIVSDNLRYRDAATPIAKQGRDLKGIVIEDDVWIGAHAVILDGVHVARGSVIAAGAVLAKDTEPYGVYAGVPGKRIAMRQ